eukprot:scaffold190893_cov28-Tisochrysis_lutea.AAC.3
MKVTAQTALGERRTHTRFPPCRLIPRTSTDEASVKALRHEACHARRVRTTIIPPSRPTMDQRHLFFSF